MIKNAVNLLHVIPFLLVSCSLVKGDQDRQESGFPVTPNATPETVALFRNLIEIQKTHILFGHQDATLYGVNWKDIRGKSDVKDVTGSYPAVYGFDFGRLPSTDSALAADKTRQAVIDAWERGGISTFCWHHSNPVTGKNFYDTTRAVYAILPGGKFHESYKKVLDNIAWYANSLKDKNGKLIPVMFRPYHEYDGDWFWWGKPFCTPEEFKSLFRFVVDYLRNEKKVTNFLFCFSPDRKFYSEADFLTRYPGNEYVDLVGIDNYWDFRPDGGVYDSVAVKLKWISDFAAKHGKIAAMTETGLESIPDSTWWTKKLYPAIRRDDIKIAYVLVWRNANAKHHYAPIPGGKSAEDFKKFRNLPGVWFEEDLAGFRGKR